MLPKGQYEPQKEEKEILNFWLENNFYKPEYSPSEKRLLTSEELPTDKRETFTIICPPPNANGNLHLGHMSGYAYQDLMARYNRMRGKKVLMIPGKDHAGIQTEVVFENELQKKGKTKLDLGREAFYRACYEFCMKNAETAKVQEQNIGLSADFDRELFTLDPRVVKEVMQAFVQMYEDGLIYRGKRLINWCVRCKSALADIDTEFKDAKSKFFYFKYGFLEPEKEAIAIKNQFRGKEVNFKVRMSPVVAHPSDENPEPLTYNDYLERGNIVSSNNTKLKVIPIGYSIEQLNENFEFKGKAIGIEMRLDNEFKLLVLNSNFSGKIKTELDNIFKFEMSRAAGAHIILFDEFPDDKFYTNGFIIGTVRPETMFGDTAIAVDPDDERYSEFIGKSYDFKTLGGTIKLNIIADNAVEESFGTGALKITPAHAKEDWDIASRHSKESMPEKQVINFDGKLNHITGKYEGMTIDEAREAMIPDLKTDGMLAYLDDNYENKIRICERCKTQIEPLVSYQWFVNTKPLKDKATQLVNDGITEIMPEGRKKTYLDWMNSPEDWCITRQLWWGYRIPVWYKFEPQEYISETGEVKEKIGDKIMEKLDDYKEFMFVGMQNPEKKLSVVMVPGKHGFMHRKIYPEILEMYPNSKTLNVANIDNPSYTDFKNELDKINWNENKNIVAHSIGTLATIRYIIDNQIKIENLFLIAPAAREKREKDQNSNYADLFDNQEDYKNLNQFVEKIYIIGSNDDELIPEENFKKFAKKFEKTTLLIERGKKHFAGGTYEFHSDQLLHVLDELNNKLSNWKQDEDVLDTWFSSGQWPYLTLKATQGDYETFYPTQVMETGWDILLFWVTRMMLLNPYRAQKNGAQKDSDQTPFENVYLHGLVLDKDGVKMSKSKGNGIDPFEMMQKYGTDALRFSFIVGNSPGQNYRLYEEKIASYRNFVNKIWNASKFVLLNVENLEDTGLTKFDPKQVKEDSNKFLINEVGEIKSKVEKLIDDFNFGIAAQLLYESFWHVFCDRCIEESKPHIYPQKNKDTGEVTSEPTDTEKQETLASLNFALKEYLKMLHPFVPFITERIWQEVSKGSSDHESLMYSSW